MFFRFVGDFRRFSFCWIIILTVRDDITRAFSLAKHGFYGLREHWQRFFHFAERWSYVMVCEEGQLLRFSICGAMVLMAPTGRERGHELKTKWSLTTSHKMALPTFLLRFFFFVFWNIQMNLKCNRNDCCCNVLVHRFN